MLSIGNWTIDQNKELAFEQGQQQGHPLDTTTLGVLLYLAENQHRIVGAPELREKFWPDTTDQSSKTIEQLRNLLGSQSISTIDENGYLLNLPVYQYDFEEVTEAQMRETMLKKELAMIARAPTPARRPARTESEPENVNNRQWLGRVVLVVVILGVIYLSQL